MGLVKSRAILLFGVMAAILIVVSITIAPRTAHAVTFPYDNVEYEIIGTDEVKAVGIAAGMDSATIPSTVENGATKYTYNVVAIEITNNAGLRVLTANDNDNLESVSITDCPILYWLEVTGNKSLSTLKLEGCLELSIVICSDNKISKLVLEGCTDLWILNCYKNALESLDVSSFTGLGGLYCGDNQIRSLELPRNSALEIVECFNNELVELDISGLTSLTGISCSGNKLSSLITSTNDNLTSLICENNELTAIDVSGYRNLGALNCDNNELASLDVSACKNIETLKVASNNLTTLDLTGLAKLEFLSCYSNALDSLVLTGCSSLSALNCYDNRLSFLDLTDCVALEYFKCSNNKFFEPIVGFTANPLRQRTPSIEQSIAVAMSHDGQGGYVSELSFPRASDVTLSEPEVSFANGYFVMPGTWIGGSGFESYSGYADTSGPVLFTESSVEFYVPFYAVTFLDYDGTSLETQLVDSGLGAVAPAVEPREGYTFKGWDKNFDRITQDTTVTAVYEKNVDPKPVDPSEPDNPGTPDTPGKPDTPSKLALAKASDHMTLAALAILAMSSFAACVVLGIRKKTRV